ncbi:MAG: bifunctional folylpolyglutamate synthase/dihydrofolate synthase [Propionibacteriaceae bacterium]|jgi:dihydrofolate synthase/folylpolyglutamate synthase|nr:bifunctional folylpolyglutamate synthase/dihydrofolate synthase [Propionibacteriaceae bacterium]
MAHTDVISDLSSRWPENKIAPSLGRIKALMELLGEPQKSASMIHITGTNGKGSTAIIADALLRAQGLRTGRYTSPHLADPRERICLDGQPISEALFDKTWAEIAPYVEMVDDQLIDGVPMTYFEVLTGMAYACFADAPVDVMVVEVGMGGRWDATNVADAAVAVFTPISLDHLEFLGDTIEKIATEKAGIIKHETRVILAGQTSEAASVLLGTAVKMGASVVREGVEFGVLDRTPAVGGQVIRLETAAGPVPDLFLPLYGADMARNASRAVAAVEELYGGRGLNPKVIADGFALVEAPARTELVHSAPPIVIDTCHNPAAVTSTLATMDEAFAFAPQIAIWGMMADKDIPATLALLEPEVQTIVVTHADTPRAMKAEALGALARGIFGDDRVIVQPSLPDAIEHAVGLADEAGPGAGILLAGSSFLAGEARTFLVSQKG